jgi:hypothetical protein
MQVEYGSILRGIQAGHDGVWRIQLSLGALPIYLSQYSYLLTIPLITAYAITFAVIKYQEGEILVPPFGSALHTC